MIGQILILCILVFFVHGIILVTCSIVINTFKKICLLNVSHQMFIQQISFEYIINPFWFHKFGLWNICFLAVTVRKNRVGSFIFYFFSNNMCFMAAVVVPICIYIDWELWSWEGGNNFRVTVCLSKNFLGSRYRKQKIVRPYCQFKHERSSRRPCRKKLLSMNGLKAIAERNHGRRKFKKYVRKITSTWWPDHLDLVTYISM